MSGHHHPKNVPFRWPLPRCLVGLVPAKGTPLQASCWVTFIKSATIILCIEVSLWCFLIHIPYRTHGSMYNNLPLKYALWAGAIGAHLVGRCVLYSYRFLDLVIRWITMGNGWNLRKLAWLKPNDVKSLQSWASQTHWASMRCGGSTKSVKAPSRKYGTIGGTYCNEIQPIETFGEYESAINFKGFEALHNIVLNINDQLLCSDVQTEDRQMYNELRRSFEMF